MRKDEVIQRTMILPSRGDGWVFTAERDIKVSKAFVDTHNPKPGDVYVEETTLSGVNAFTEKAN